MKEKKKRKTKVTQSKSVYSLGDMAAPRKIRIRENKD